MDHATDSGSVAGLVLAAGASTRMGRNKLLCVLEGETLLRRSTRRAVDAALAPVVVVLGHEAELAGRELAGLSCQPVLNRDYRMGMSGSLAAGLAALPPTVSAAVVILADMPFVTTDMMRALVERYRSSASPLVVSDYGGVVAPPLLYDRALFPELTAMTGDGCGKRVYRRHQSEAASVAWPPEALSDLDVPEDLDRASARLAAS